MKKSSKLASLIALSLLLGSIGLAQGADAHGRGVDRKSQKVKVVAKQDIQPDAIASLAAMFGLTEADLNTLLQAKTGQSLAGLASLLNVSSIDAIMSKLTTYESAQIDAQVAAKKLTAKQASVLKKGLAKKVTKFVDQIFLKVREGTAVEDEARWNDRASNFESRAHGEYQKDSEHHRDHEGDGAERD
jgi:hypothetical protein